MQIKLSRTMPTTTLSEEKVPTVLGFWSSGLTVTCRQQENVLSQPLRIWLYITALPVTTQHLLQAASAYCVPTD